jgi:catechol 2,3-dioxygenase-like lactoylglutathione lyase family enzyme
VSLHHVGLVVADLERSAEWYARVLGLAREYDFEIPPANVRGCFVGRADGLRLELFERPGSRAYGDRTTPNAALGVRGYGHICLASDDLDGDVAAIAAAGATVVWEPRPSPEPGVRMAFIADPDGNLIELLQRAG